MSVAIATLQLPQREKINTIWMLKGEAMFYPTKTAIACTIAAVLVTLSVPLIVQAQEVKPARIGIVRSSPPPAQNLAAFREGMRDRAHVEGKTYVIVPAESTPRPLGGWWIRA